MLYTNKTNNEFFTEGKFNFDKLAAVSNQKVVDTLQELLISTITRISITESTTKLFTNIAIFSLLEDVIFIRYDNDYDLFTFNMVHSLVFDDLELKITRK